MRKHQANLNWGTSNNKTNLQSLEVSWKSRKDRDGSTSREYKKTLQWNAIQNSELDPLVNKWNYCRNWQNLKEVWELDCNNTVMLISWFWYILCKRKSLSLGWWESICSLLSNGSGFQKTSSYSYLGLQQDGVCDLLSNSSEEKSSLYCT